MGLISRKEGTEKPEANTIEETNLSNRENRVFNRKKNEKKLSGGCGIITISGLSCYQSPREEKEGGAEKVLTEQGTENSY